MLIDDDILKTNFHGMEQDIHMVSGDRMENFSNYSFDFQVWLSLASIVLGSAIGSIQALNDKKGQVIFIVSLVLCIVFMIFLRLSYLRVRSIKSKLMTKINPNLKLQIVEARFTAPSNEFDVTDKVIQLMQNGRINTVASIEIFGDPQKGAQKTLTIKYSQSGSIKERKFDENAKVILP